MMASLLLPLALLLSSPFLTSSQCPDFPFLRSDFIASGSFREDRLVGFFTEQYYYDIAQIGASCQTLNVTTSSSSTTTPTISMAFSVKYGPIPFTINEIYSPLTNSPLPGLFNKKVDMPGGKYLTIPTVILDVAEDYSTMSLYSCLELPGENAIKELVIATLDPNPPQETLTKLLNSALALVETLKEEDIKSTTPC
ncbi:hypothetical protein TrLO_g658 [Triparma laevis f. longispina]|uniref:Uncharacterized protein n=1 Tax=Triparma laevis f. longispina TaxID=1714387 RepID=A0A9W7L007_9STRA|nr:hypothetical protein TrLO_g658 [Triparma laevis f. longispina]